MKYFVLTLALLSVNVYSNDSIRRFNFYDDVPMVINSYEISGALKLNKLNVSIEKKFWTLYSVHGDFISAETKKRVFPMVIHIRKRNKVSQIDVLILPPYDDYKNDFGLFHTEIGAFLWSFMIHASNLVIPIPNRKSIIRSLDDNHIVSTRELAHYNVDGPDWETTRMFLSIERIRQKVIHLKIRKTAYFASTAKAP